VGKQGVCDDEGSLYPAGILLGRLLNLKQAALIKTTVNEPLQCSSLLLADDKKYLFMANHTGHTIRVKLPFPISTIQTIQPFPSSVIKMETAATDIIELTAYAVVELS
jgi:hypothetical protein